MNKDEKMTLTEFAEMHGINPKKAIDYICDCNLLYGFHCDYHGNPEIKFSIKEWKNKACQCGHGWIYLFHSKKKNHYKNAFKAIKSKLESMDMDARKDFLKNKKIKLIFTK